MYQRFFAVLSVLVLLVMAGCTSPDPTPVAEAVVEPTKTSEPTETAVPPTETAVPTDTPEPTATNTATPTATATNSPTPSPEPTETPAPTQTPVPLPTETAVPAPPAPPPAQPATGSPPVGPNLIVNPGFEYGIDGWNIGVGSRINMTFQNPAEQPQFVHSGSSAADTIYSLQSIGNMQVGVNYRAGVWVKIWASDGENRNVSENAGNAGAKICIDTNGDRDLNLPTTICSPIYQPFDTWRYITVDAIPIRDHIVVSIVGYRSSTNTHSTIVWDDVAVGLSPTNAVATAIPVPPSPSEPGPPAAVPFNAQSARDNMNNARSMLEQMGGLLDRLLNGSRETCGEYTGYYRGLVASARYDGVPVEWQGVYNEYIFAVEHGTASNYAIFSTCFSGSGHVSELNYGIARDGINGSLNRLIPAVDTANGMP